MARRYDDLITALDADLVVDLTRRLVALDTQNPPGNEKQCAEFIRDTLSEWGIETELVREPDPARPQVVARLKGREPGPTLILNGHMDTVGAGDPQAWRHPPLEATMEDDRLYGLGTADMKGALAIAMVVLKTLKEAGRPRAGTLMFQAAMGEEMDEPGTRTLLQKGYTGDWAIVLEPTDLKIGPGTRGACWHDITFTGSSTHCGLVPGETADVMQAVSAFGSAIAELHGSISRKAHHLMPSPACRITHIEGGRAHNATVDTCRLTVDRRMLPDETFDDITRELTALLGDVVQGHPGVSYEIGFVAGNEPTETALESPLIRALEAAHDLVLGRKAEVWGPPYGSDMRNFVWDAGIPATNFGPGDFTVCHQPNEHVKVEDLANGARIVLAATLDLLES